jgi:pyruvate dehydrogenase E2 component (dihydrolipoamide acetyltransferase)
VGEFIMPSLGADMEAGTLVAWCKAPGDSVTRGDIIAEVETDKGVIEVEVFESGVVAEMLVEPGTKVPVGTVLARIDPGPERSTKPAPTPAPVPEPAPVPVPVPDAALPAPTAAPTRPAPRGAPDAPPFIPASPRARRLARDMGLELDDVPGTGPGGAIVAADVQRASALRAQAPATPPVPTLPDVVRASPSARALAAEHGIDLHDVEGTGPHGAIGRADVKRLEAERVELERAARAAAGPARAAKAPAAGSARVGAETELFPEEKQARMRRAIAAAMARSKREIPHYYLSHTIDMGPATAWLERENADRDVSDRLLPGALLIKATAVALRKFPDMNAWWTGEEAEAKDGIHCGVAIALRGGGLVAPAVHDTDERSLDELMAALKDLVERARSGRLRGREMGEATITISSLGDRGVDALWGVITPPQVAIVGFGKVADKPWVVGGGVAPRPVVTATLAADHRVSDGHRGGLFLARIAKLLQHPEKL